MAILRTPDGSEIEVPDGLTADQVAAIFQAHSHEVTRRAAHDTLEDSSGFEKFGIGVARPFVEMGLGIKDLAAKAGIGHGLDDEDRSNLERMSQVEGGAATAGRITGEAAQFLLPGGVVGKAGSMFPRALARYAIPAADIATSAGMEALKAPTDETSRMDRAISGAEGALGGQVVGKIFKSALRGLSPTKYAEEMLDDGIRLTPGQAAGGGLQTLEQNLAKLPVVGPAVRARQKEALSAWNLKLLADSAGADVTAAGPLGFQQATKLFSDAYDFHWDRPMNLNLPKLGNAWGNLVDDTQKRLGPEASNAIHQKLVSIWENDLLPAIDKKTGNMHGTQLQSIDSALGEAASEAGRKGEGDIAKYLGRARSELRDQYPQAFRESLEDLNRKYAEFAVQRRAGTAINGPAAGQPYTPAQLLAASKALDRSAGKGNTARGQAVLQQAANDAAQVFAKSGGAPASIIEKLGLLPAGLLARPFYSKAGSNLLTGQSAAQRAIKDVVDDPEIEAILNALRQYERSGQLGAAIANPDEQ